MVALAKALHGTGPRPTMSFREVADELFQQGFGVGEKGAKKGDLPVKPFTAIGIKRMVEI